MFCILYIIWTLPSGASTSKLIALGAVHVHSRREEEISRREKKKRKTIAGPGPVEQQVVAEETRF
jgi:hypothetical protein